MKFRKLLALLCILAITFSFAACTNEPPEPEGRTPEQAIEGFMAAYAAMDYDMLAEYTYTDGHILDDFYYSDDAYGNSEKIVVQKLMEKQTYEIIEILDVEEDKKIAKILLTYYDSSPLLIETIEDDDYDEPTLEALLQAIYDARLERLKTYDPAPQQQQVMLGLYKADADWQVVKVNLDTNYLLLANSLDYHSRRQNDEANG